MCGILGYLGNIDQASFKHALDTITHRGPDGYGIWEGDQITLGHRRLSIIDLSDNGKQPMQAFDRYYVTFNGEIYNYIEIRAELEKEGFQFTSDSDTEVMLKAYIKWGTACLDRFNGMWALAIWDKEKRELFMSRDRVGKKPLFYSQNEKRFAFGSEMKALYPFLDEVRPNMQLIDRIKQSAYEPDYEQTEHCLIEGIKRFPAGHYGIYKEGNLSLYQYWNQRDHLLSDVPKRYEEQQEIFRELFYDACRIRMRSDVPLGTALSGGIDSSTVLSAMAEVAKTSRVDSDWQHAFVASFPGSKNDETEFAKMVVNNTGVQANFLEIDPLRDIDQLEYYQYMMEELSGSPPNSFIQLYKSIKDGGVTVSIDGHGADELFGGYPFTLAPAMIDAFPSPKNMRMVYDIINDSSASGDNQYTNYLKYATKNKLSFLFSKGADSAQKYPELSYFNSKLLDLTYTDILPYLLRNYDRYAMINGVEIRMPFLDYRILNFAFSINYQSKLHDGYTKSIIRDTFSDIVPREIMSRKVKVGFNSPFGDWIRGPLKGWVMDLMESQSFKESVIIDPVQVRKKVEDVINKPEINYEEGAHAWGRLMYYIWEKSLQFAQKPVA